MNRGFRKARCTLYRIDKDDFEPGIDTPMDPAREWWALAIVVVLMMCLILFFGV